MAKRTDTTTTTGMRSTDGHRAGDGRVLLRLSEAANAGDRTHIDNLFAIEKSVVHLMAMPKSVVVVGTDFLEQSLIDKPVRYIFSNPPYSQYELWTEKILRECNARFVYLVIPASLAR